MKGQGTPPMILRGELESMSKKMKEKRNSFGGKRDAVSWQAYPGSCV